MYGLTISKWKGQMVEHMHKSREQKRFHFVIRSNRDCIKNFLIAYKEKYKFFRWYYETVRLIEGGAILVFIKIALTQRPVLF
jgi:hypothetical protein